MYLTCKRQNTEGFVGQQIVAANDYNHQGQYQPGAWHLAVETLTAGTQKYSVKWHASMLSAPSQR